MIWIVIAILTLALIWALVALDSCRRERDAAKYMEAHHKHYAEKWWRALEITGAWTLEVKEQIDAEEAQHD